MLGKVAEVKTMYYVGNLSKISGKWERILWESKSCGKEHEKKQLVTTSGKKAGEGGGEITLLKKGTR